jgi:hypothetical protein
MNKIAADIIAIIGDYRNDEGIKLNETDIINWVNQFDENDREFILTEFLYLLKQGIYLSKERAKVYLHNNLQELAKHFNYKNLSSFLANAHFLNIQSAEKSQVEIIQLMNELLTEKYNFSVELCGSVSRKHYIYLDDILATGATLCRSLEKWLAGKLESGDTAFELFANKKIDIVASFFCFHTWGWANAQYVLSKKLNNERLLKGILLQYDYQIQNNAKFNNQDLNCLIPCGINNIAENYLVSLPAENHSERARRNNNSPANETFFSSPPNRIRFETIMLHKGIEIINRIKNLTVPNIRPLGYTGKNHKTFGLGTMYFTWRNISNTCPLVFWWDNNDWKGLFPLKNRGGSKSKK